MSETNKWHIWSIEHDAWWAENANGYVGKRESAGVYSYSEACEIVRMANIASEDVPMEAMVAVVENDK